MSGTTAEDQIPLNILVEGDDPVSSTFCTSTTGNQMFHELARDIQAAYRDVAGKELKSLKLFRFNQNDSGLKDFSFTNATILNMRDEVSSVWPTRSSVNRKFIHILVRAQILPSKPRSSSPEMQADGPRLDNQIEGLLQKFQRMQLQFIKSLAPRSSSQAAELSWFLKQQRTENYILNGRPRLRTGLPVVIYHPVFGRFLSSLRARDTIPSRTYSDMLRYFTTSQEIYEVEYCDPLDQTGEGQQKRTARDQTCRGELAKLLGGFLSRSSAYGTQPDGLQSSMAGECIMLMELKNEIGTGGSDPSIQAAQLYSRYLADMRFRSLLQKCCCPSILVAIAGPWTCILGAVFLDRPVVQPLTHLLWVGDDPSRPAESEYLARVFHSLVSARNELINFYRSLEHSQGAVGKFFPYITHYTDSKNRRVEFEYVRPLCGADPAHGKPIFLAATRGAGTPKDIVVKFVQRYNGEAQSLLASHGLAPTLLYDGTKHADDQPGPDHFMVVMEFLHGADLSKYSYSLPEWVVADIDKALEYLHDAGFVFGDLRDPNVMIKVDSEGRPAGAMLIDFDWCGRHQETRYPTSMNPYISWATGAGPGSLMDKSHDIDMRSKLCLNI